MNLIRIDIKKNYWEWILDGQIIMRGNFINYTRDNLRLTITNEHHEMDFPLNQIIIEYIKK
jgi:hypothetical protein